MKTVEAIEKAVEDLAPEQLSEFRRWFAEFDGAVWDAQIERDAAAGKLDALAAEAMAEYQSGQVREI